MTWFLWNILAASLHCFKCQINSLLWKTDFLPLVEDMIPNCFMLISCKCHYQKGIGSSQSRFNYTTIRNDTCRRWTYDQSRANHYCCQGTRYLDWSLLGHVCNLSLWLTATHSHCIIGVRKENFSKWKYSYQRKMIVGEENGAGKAILNVCFPAPQAHKGHIYKKWKQNYTCMCITHQVNDM